jgi:uncharacterized protein
MDRAKTIEDIRLIPDTIGEAGIEKDLTVSPDAMASILADKDLSVEEPFHIHYEVKRRKENLHASVDIRGLVRTNCSKCLGPMTHAVDVHLESEYVPAPPEMQGELEAERTSAEVGYYRKELLLGQYIVSELVLSLPIIYTCSEGCRGLCPQCGANLNEGPCACAPAPDPRFQVLDQLKNKL